MPLALLAIGSALDSQQYEVVIVDGRLDPRPEQTLLAALPDAVCLGVTVLTGSPLGDAMRITRLVRARYPDLSTVWGGWHPSIFPQQTLADEPTVSITVQGQGEVTFRELVDRLAQDQPLSDLPGITYRQNGTIIRNPARPMADMNQLPPLNYDLIPIETYFARKGKRQLDYISSTGCFFRCAFCADPFVFQRKWTGLDSQRIVDELTALKEKYNFNDVNFQDETFFTYRKRVVALAQGLIDRQLGITWAGTMRADQGSRLSEDDFALCARSGLRRVLIGVESGSQEMMDWMQKDIKVEQVLACADRCQRHGIDAIFPFIVGFPGESDASVEASLRLARQLTTMSPRFTTPFFYFKPYPGSHITHQVTENGYRLPATLQEWTDFDYIGSSGPWVDAAKYRRIEAFKFYNRLAGRPRHWVLAPLQKLAAWRCATNRFGWPWDKLLYQMLRPEQQLS